MTTPDPSVSQPSVTPHSELPTPHSARPRRAKIARLPKTTRDQINQRLLDGVPYRDIIAQLGLQLWDITEDNLHCWKQGGYQDWLRTHEWLAQLRAQTTLATDLLRQQDNATFHQASLQLALSQLANAFRNSGPSLLAENPHIYLRLLLVLCRLSQQSLRYERCRQTRAQTQPMQLSAPAPSHHQRQILVGKLRHLLNPD